MGGKLLVWSLTAPNGHSCPAVPFVGLGMRIVAGYLASMIKIALSATLLAAMCLPALATVDFQLSEEPASHTTRSCRAWASSQHDAATLKSWGKTKDGTSSMDVAVLRLTLACLGDDPPQIVFFGSSMLGSSRFCKDPKFSQEKICASTVAYCRTHKEDC